MNKSWLRQETVCVMVNKMGTVCRKFYRKYCVDIGTIQYYQGEERQIPRVVSLRPCWLV